MSTSPLSFDTERAQLTCPALAEFDLRWVLRGSVIKASGVVNDTYVDLCFNEADAPMSGGFFSSTVTNVSYYSLTVRTTTAPTPHCRSDVTVRHFTFSDYGLQDIVDQDAVVLVRELKAPVFSWSRKVDEQGLFDAVKQYVNWVTTSGYNF